MDTIEEAKSLKTQLAKIISDFSDRTKYIVKEIEISTRSHQDNVGGRRIERLLSAHLEKVTIQSPDGTVVEV